MDYTAEIQYNNERIAALRKELAGLGAGDANMTDYSLAAQRARSYDLDSAQYHLGRVDNRIGQDRIAQERASESKTESDYEYNKLVSAVLDAETELSWTPQENTGAVKAAQNKLAFAKNNLDTFMKNHPGYMKWNWSGMDSNDPPAGSNTKGGLRGLIQSHMIMRDDGNVYRREDVDPSDVWLYAGGIPGYAEDKEIGEMLEDYRNSKTVSQYVSGDTLHNLEVTLNDPNMVVNGRPKTDKIQKELEGRYERLSPEEKNTTEGMKLKTIINNDSQETVNRNARKESDEGYRMLGRQKKAVKEMFINGTIPEFTDSTGTTWVKGSGYLDDGRPLLRKKK